MITLRPWLDRLLLATLVVTTWHKLHWAPGAGDVTLEDVLAAGFVALFITDRCLRHDWRMHRVALGLLLAMGVLEVVYLGGYFALQNGQELSQYAKGMTKFALHFGFLVCGTQYVIDRGERMLRRTIGALILGLLINCAYGVAQLAAQVGAGINLDKAIIGPLTFGQGSLGGINVYGQATAVQQGSYVSLGVYRVNALALDPNHLGIMLARADPDPAAVRAARGAAHALGRAAGRARGGLRRGRAAHALALGHARAGLRPARPGVAVAPATAAHARRRAGPRASWRWSASPWPRRPTRARSSARA